MDTRTGVAQDGVCRPPTMNYANPPIAQPGLKLELKPGLAAARIKAIGPAVDTLVGVIERNLK